MTHSDIPNYYSPTSPLQNLSCQIIVMTSHAAGLQVVVAQILSAWQESDKALHQKLLHPPSQPEV